jgi:hypothetical protein
MTKLNTLEAIRRKFDEKNWKAELATLKRAHLKKAAPAFYEASGGDTMKITAYSDKTANGLTKCIVDFLNYSGFYANRINTQGQARVRRQPKYNILSGQVEYRQKVEYTKSTTRKGTADIDAIVYGTPVKIEIKIGRDRMSEDQTQEQSRVTQAGGMYVVATDMVQFRAWFKKTFGE